jgi:type IV pilus assembly protein PilA
MRYSKLLEIFNQLRKTINFGKAKQGFSLIELMVVVAIAALLAAIAIPNYSNYTRGAKVVEMIASIDPCQTRIYQEFLREGGFPATMRCLGQNLTDTAPGEFISNDIRVRYNGTATATCARFILNRTDLTTADGTAPLEAAVWIIRTAEGDIRYGCGAGLSNPVPEELLPRNCRGTTICT